MMVRSSLAVVAAIAMLSACQAQIMSVDLGHEFFKVGLMRQGHLLEIVLNTHSKRKTTNAVSFFENVRTFGDDAIAHQGKAPAKVPMFYHSTLGKNYTSKDIEEGGQWWNDFGLGGRFYVHNLGWNAERGVPNFKLSDTDTKEGEELLASIFHFCKKIAEDAAEGETINVRDLVVTVPAGATLRQRQAIVAAGEIAGLRVVALAHEGTSFAVQRALDYSPEKGQVEHGLFYNLGSRKAEVTIVKYESRAAGMVAGKTAPVVTVLGSAIDFSIGGHLMDLKIAEVMLKRFQDKYPKLADGIAKNPRALRKLLSQAQKSKATLSANKQAPFTVESLYEDTDFQAGIRRDEFEEMCADMFSRLTDPIEAALKSAGITLADIGQVEVVGGAWRVPKIQEILSAYLDAGKGAKLPLGQHLNGEEAAALGSALIAANMSSSFRVRQKIFLTDFSQHEYAVQVMSLSGEWEKNITVLFPTNTILGSKKKIALSMEEDFGVRLFENGVLLSEYEVTGLKTLLETKWKDYNRTGSPKISASVLLEHSGIVEIKTPTATVEELYWVNVTRPKEKPNVTNETDAPAAEEKKEDAAADGENEEEKSEEAKPEEAKSEEDAEAAKEGEKSAGDGADDATANASGNGTNASEVEMETVLKQKKKKHEKKLIITRKDYLPRPLNEENIKELTQKLADTAQFEKDVQAMAGLKNDLESAIYSSRDKIEMDDFIKVTTAEQREELLKMTTELEEWMYETGMTKSDYEAKLNGLQALVGPIEERAHELEARSTLADTVKESLADMARTQKHIAKNMSWVNENKTEAAATKLDEFKEWWAKKTEQQKNLPLHEAPAYTVKEVQEKLQKLDKEWDKLKKMKKPKEPKAKKNETAKDTKKGGKEKKTGVPPEDLPQTVEGVDQELTALRANKAAAVEKEDFDLAHSLKQREKALTAQLEKLKAEKTEL